MRDSHQHINWFGISQEVSVMEGESSLKITGPLKSMLVRHSVTLSRMNKVPCKKLYILS